MDHVVVVVVIVVEKDRKTAITITTTTTIKNIICQAVPEWKLYIGGQGREGEAANDLALEQNAGPPDHGSRP
jgi:hypothetical protein